MFYLSGGRQHREMPPQEIIHETCRALDWIIQINIDIKALELCGRPARAESPSAKAT